MSDTEPGSPRQAGAIRSFCVGDHSTVVNSTLDDGKSRVVVGPKSEQLEQERSRDGNELLPSLSERVQFQVL